MAQDENIAAFIIQGSADGKNWSDLAKENNSTSAGNIINYTKQIDRTDPSIKYYRLASLGLHDKIEEYSNIISVQENCNVETSINIYPNPSTGLFNIANTGDAILHIEVKDILGKTVMVSKNTEQLDLKSFADGIYFVSCTTLKGDVFNIKIVKE